MKTKRQLKAVIFDLDGVLVDTAQFHGEAWANLVRSIGIEPPADVKDRVRGISRMESLKIALGSHAGDFSEAELEALASKKNAEYVKACQTITPADLFEGALSLLDGLRSAGIHAAIGSASKNSRMVLEKLGILDRFDAISDGFTHTRAKPDPEVFLVAAQMLKLDPSECIVVEDAEAGIEAALAGGFVAVGMGRKESLHKAHHCVTKLTELNAQTLCALHQKLTA